MSDQPLVSCIMPTRNRARFVPQAIQHFLQQDYPNRELIVMDNSDEPVKHLLPDDDRLRYIYGRVRMTIGLMRNVACGQATGDLICHWDDDDWYAPNRISEQVEILTELMDEFPMTEAMGYRQMLFARDADRRAWSYSGDKRNVVGVSLMYTRSCWERTKFETVAVMGELVEPMMCGEDSRFCSRLGARLAPAEPCTTIVARIHPENSSSKDEKLALYPWVEVPWSEVEALGYQPCA